MVSLSGHSEQDAASHLKSSGATTFLQKSFDIESLLKAVAKVKPAN